MSQLPSLKSMKRDTLRAINRIQSDQAFIATVSTKERSQESASKPAIMGGVDPDRGTISVKDLNGGSSNGKSITNSYITSAGQLVPAFVSNGSFNTVDAKPYIP